ncbi:MAG: hypothetical protein JWQ25_1231 [Daejeonella sp.]|nr:hypothetical protein [Daejeonella sp.]
MSKKLTDKGHAAIPVKNAGIVLLSTYVSMLFERMGFTEGNSFKTNKHQLDAVYYLQYVITGLLIRKSIYLF